MTDEDVLIKASKNKGRSASVCFSPRSDRGLAAAATVTADFVDTSISLSPLPSHSHSLLSTPTWTAPAPAPSPATTDDADTRYVRSKPASRSQSVRLSGGKSFRRRAFQSNSDSPHADNSHRLATGVSEPKLHSYGVSASDTSTCSGGSVYRERHNFRSQRKSAAFLDIPISLPSKTQSANRQVEDNSYRLRSFSFTTKGLVNRGDSFRRRHGRCSSIFLAHESNKDVQCEESLDKGTRETTAPISPSAPGIITYNVFVMGATNVGKTSLVNQFMTSECINPYDRDRDEPSQQTISIMLNGEESELCFHELKHSKSFQKRYTADAFLILYSVVDKSTFQYAETELGKLHDSNILINKPAILVANKIDLARSRTVSAQDGKCLACTFRVKHVEISVGINHNVDELLVGVLNQIRLKKQHCDQENAAQHQHQPHHHWYKNRAMIRASMKARQMFTWIFGREDSKFKNCENLHTL